MRFQAIDLCGIGRGGDQSHSHARQLGLDIAWMSDIEDRKSIIVMSSTNRPYEIVFLVEQGGLRKPYISSYKSYYCKG